MKNTKLSDEQILAMAMAAIAEENVDIKRIRVISFRRIRKTALEQYVEDHAITYRKFLLPALSANN